MPHRKLSALVNHVFVATAAPSRLATTAAMVWLTDGGNYYLSRTIARRRAQPVLAYGFDAYMNGCSENYSPLTETKWNVWSS